MPIFLQGRWRLLNTKGSVLDFLVRSQDSPALEYISNFLNVSFSLDGTNFASFLHSFVTSTFCLTSKNLLWNSLSYERVKMNFIGPEAKEMYTGHCPLSNAGILKSHYLHILKHIGEKNHSYLFQPGCFPALLYKKFTINSEPGHYSSWVVFLSVPSILHWHSWRFLYLTHYIYG